MNFDVCILKPNTPFSSEGSQFSKSSIQAIDCDKAYPLKTEDGKIIGNCKVYRDKDSNLYARGVILDNFQGKGFFEVLEINALFYVSSEVH